MSDLDYEKRRGKRDDRLLIYLFDRDEKNIIDKMSNGHSNFKKHGRGLYSLILPFPEDRTDKICIEYLYSTEGIKNIRDGAGKRLYLREEFKDSAWHTEDNVIYLNYKGERSGLVIEDPIYFLDTRQQANLSKGEFSYLVADLAETINFSGFDSLFTAIESIKQDYYLRDLS